jgi:hypothetical protein
MTGLQKRTVSTRQTNLRKVLEAGLDVEHSFLTGSYSRNTMIAPLKAPVLGRPHPFQPSLDLDKIGANGSRHLIH